MIHIRVDDGECNEQRKFACGIGPDLPPGDKYFFLSERGAHHQVDCPGCGGPQPLGTPISKLSGRPGHAGYENFAAIARSWGHD